MIRARVIRPDPHGYYWVVVGRRRLARYSAPGNALRHAARLNRAFRR